MPPRARRAATREIIDRLFADPPVNQADLARRLAGADPAEARRLLADRLALVTGERDGELAVVAFERLGVGPERARIVAVAANRDLGLRARACALAVLSAGDARRLESLLTRLAPDAAAELTELPLVDLLGSIQAAPERVGDLVRAISLVPAAGRGLLIDRIEHHRRRVGTSAAAVYGAVLDDPEFSEHRGRLVSILVDEAGPDTIALLETARDHCADRESRRALQGAVLRARTRTIEPERSPAAARGFALVGTCDGQGAFIVLGGFENPDGTWTIADVCIRVAADLRDGFVLPRRTEVDLRRLADEVAEETGSRFARVPLAEASWLVEQAVARTRDAGLAIPETALPAVSLFERAGEGRAPTPAAAPAVRAPVEEVARVLARPEYDAWFFDRGDLVGHGAPPPRRSTPGARWIDRTAARLDTPEVRRRVAAMADFMALHHAWRGEPLEASLLAAAARDTEADFRSSALVRAMLARSTEPAAGAPRGGFGDPDVRRHLKDRFFHAVRTPRGRDLARLDLAEAALASLGNALASLPGERRPREEAASEAAFALGKIFADHMTRGRKQPVARLARHMADALGASCHLDSDETWCVLREVLPALGAFVDQVCARCPTSCLARPAAGVAELFFGPDHPASGRR